MDFVFMFLFHAKNDCFKDCLKASAQKRKKGCNNTVLNLWTANVKKGVIAELVNHVRKDIACSPTLEGMVLFRIRRKVRGNMAILSEGKE